MVWWVVLQPYRNVTLSEKNEEIFNELLEPYLQEVKKFLLLAE